MLTPMFPVSLNINTVKISERFISKKLNQIDASQFGDDTFTTLFFKRFIAVMFFVLFVIFITDFPFSFFLKRF